MSGEGGTTVTFGSSVSLLRLVSVLMMLGTAICCDPLAPILDSGERTSVREGLVTEGARLRVREKLERCVLDSDRSRVVGWAGDAALVNFDKKLGAIFEDYSVSSPCSILTPAPVLFFPSNDWP